MASPPVNATVKRLDGQALQRTNFMAWAIDLLGSADAAKRHFRSLRQVSRQPGLFLIEPAQLRFEAARAAFEAQHPGYTFPDTDVALGLRGFHQARQGIGMLGHALGIAFDFRAHANPNLKVTKDFNDHYGYLVNRFGGDGDKPGHSTMVLGPDVLQRLAQLGRDTVAGHVTAVDDALVETIRSQFEEMVATSRRFQAAMAAQLPALRQARDDYFNARELEKELAKATDDVQHADAVADRRMKQEKFSGDEAAKAERRVEIKGELEKKQRDLGDALKVANAGILMTLSGVFRSWSAAIAADIAAANARKATSDAEIAALTRARQDLDAIDLAAPTAIDALSQFADHHQLPKPHPVPPAKRYQAILRDALAARFKRRRDDDPLSPVYIGRELGVLTKWQNRIQDPAFVFGTGKVVAHPAGATVVTVPGSPPPAGAPSVAGASAPAGDPSVTGAAATPAGAPPAVPAPAPAKHWASVIKAEEIPLMQLIEHGFVQQEEMPARPGRRDRQQVFNVEVVTTLARFGFGPGARFRDTMHFDFIEGYAVVPRALRDGNLTNVDFGPSGDLPTPAPKTSPASAPTKGSK